MNRWIYLDFLFGNTKHPVPIIPIHSVLHVIRLTGCFARAPAIELTWLTSVESTESAVNAHMQRSNASNITRKMLVLMALMGLVVKDTWKISTAFVIVGSLLSSLPWPLRLPSPVVPPPHLWGLVSVRRPHSNFTPAALPFLSWKAFLSLACPWGFSACCCQTNTANIFFTVSLIVCCSGRLSSFILARHSYFQRVVSPCHALSSDIALLQTSYVFGGFIPPAILCFFDFSHAVSSVVPISPEDVLRPCVGKCRSAFLSCVLFMI